MDEQYVPPLIGENCVLPKETKGGPLLMLPLLERTEVELVL